MAAELAIPDHHDLTTWSDRRLDNAIKRGHAACGRFMDGYEHTATLTGVLLRERQGRLGSRKFKPWLREHFNGSIATAYRYLELAEERAPIVLTDENDNPPEEPKPNDLIEREETVENASEVVEEEEEIPTTKMEIQCPHCHGTGWVALTTKE